MTTYSGAGTGVDRPRATAVLAGCVLGATAVGWLARTARLPSSVLTARAEDLAVPALLWLAVALLGWLALGALLALLADLPGLLGQAAARAAARVTPAVMRRMLGVAVASSLATGALPATSASALDSALASGMPAATATVGHAVWRQSPLLPIADDQPVTSAATEQGDPAFRPSTPSSTRNGSSPSPTTQTDAVVSPDFMPTRPVPVTPDHGGLLTPAPRPAASGSVVVQRGDTLWDIAARHLGVSAGSADICVEWHAWYAANRAVIGDDPDLILPGTRLVPPTTGDHR